MERPQNREDARFCDECAISLVSADNQEMAPEFLRDSPSGLVGRHQELQELLAALEDAGTGRGRLVMMVREPGIGTKLHGDYFNLDFSFLGRKSRIPLGP